jgi:hypothetical protein
MATKTDGINLLENADAIADLRKKSSSSAEARRQCVQVVLFVIFISIFTGLILVDPYSDFYSFEQSVR